jgi:hypothetical protein
MNDARMRWHNEINRQAHKDLRWDNSMRPSGSPGPGAVLVHYHRSAASGDGFRLFLRVTGGQLAAVPQ